MSEMVERVAGALWPWLRRWMPDHATQEWHQIRVGSLPHQVACDAARAAIAAMREPTPGMVEAGDVMTMSQMGPVKTYQAMITAALGDA
jgi:hypothetical protein